MVCGLALAGVAALGAWWQWLRRSPAKTEDTRRWGLHGRYTQTGPFAIFARYPFRSPREAAAMPPIVLVHGMVVSSRMVEPLAGVLARHFRVIAPDLPGFGESTKPARLLTVPELADALALWLRTKNMSRVIPIGTSLGCHVVVELAVRHPELVDRLVLQGPGLEPEARRLWWALWRQAVNSWREPRSLGRISRVDYAKAGLWRAAASVRAALVERIEDQLPRVQAPTLVVRGSRDVIVPQHWAERVTRLLPRGRLAVIEGGAHVLSYGAPEAFVAAILPFLQEAIVNAGDN